MSHTQEIKSTTRWTHQVHWLPLRPFIKCLECCLNMISSSGVSVAKWKLIFAQLQHNARNHNAIWQHVASPHPNWMSCFGWIFHRIHVSPASPDPNNREYNTDVERHGLMKVAGLEPCCWSARELISRRWPPIFLLYIYSPICVPKHGEMNTSTLSLLSLTSCSRYPCKDKMLMKFICWSVQAYEDNWDQSRRIYKVQIN